MAQCATSRCSAPVLSTRPRVPRSLGALGALGPGNTLCRSERTERTRAFGFCWHVSLKEWFICMLRLGGRQSRERESCTRNSIHYGEKAWKRGNTQGIRHYSARRSGSSEEPLVRRDRSCRPGVVLCVNPGTRWGLTAGRRFLGRRCCVGEAASVRGST